jgi:hypothetical protein
MLHGFRIHKKFNLIYAHKKSMGFPVPFFM